MRGGVNAKNGMTYSDAAVVGLINLRTRARAAKARASKMATSKTSKPRSKPTAKRTSKPKSGPTKTKVSFRSKPTAKRTSKIKRQTAQTSTETTHLAFIAKCKSVSPSSFKSKPRPVEATSRLVTDKALAKGLIPPKSGASKKRSKRAKLSKPRITKPRVLKRPRKCIPVRDSARPLLGAALLAALTANPPGQKKPRAASRRISAKNGVHVKRTKNHRGPVSSSSVTKLSDLSSSKTSEVRACVPSEEGDASTDLGGGKLEERTKYLERLKQTALDVFCHEIRTVESVVSDNRDKSPYVTPRHSRLVFSTAMRLHEAKLLLSSPTYDSSDCMPVDESFMLSRPRQSNITRTLIDFSFKRFPPSPHNIVVTAADSASTLQLAVKAMLHNLREKEIGKVLGFAGSMTLNRVGDLVIKHHIAGSYILEAAVVQKANLPSGTGASLGLSGINAIDLAMDVLRRQPPSQVWRPKYARVLPPKGLDWSKLYVSDKAGKRHPVIWDGVIDTRMGERAFVLFKDGSSSLVLGKALRHTSSSARVNLDIGVAPKCIFSKCMKAIEQGLCPRHCGRKTSCCLAHFVDARDIDGFVHPGYVRPGMDLTDPKHFLSAKDRKAASSCTSAETKKPKVAGPASTLAAKAVKPLVKSSRKKAKRAPARLASSLPPLKSSRKKAKRAPARLASSLPPLAPFIKECNKRLAKAKGEQLPAAWLEKAVSFGVDHPEKSG